MCFIEVLALCGITQIITASYLFAPVRANVPTKHLKYLMSCAQCMGFWVGSIFYATVALSTELLPSVAYVFPLAEAVAMNANVYVQWAMVLLFGALISISTVLVNHVIEVLHFGKMWFVTEIEKGMMNQYRDNDNN